MCAFTFSSSTAGDCEYCSLLPAVAPLDLSLALDMDAGRIASIATKSPA